VKVKKINETIYLLLSNALAATIKQSIKSHSIKDDGKRKRSRRRRKRRSKR